ncbi:MazG family protein [Phaeacidiphilus oryzae]|uniref:MazG family protein n=1 Tax=Phaeacidiphilus oryzae TaxID=348818 RepID=UPI000B2E82ED|nr:MazG family protein [Phaeacidiphilus oryzae]
MPEIDDPVDNPASPAPAGRLVLLATTHRIAPGLLSWPAWETLREADRVLVGDPEHPQLAPIRQAGVRVEVVDAPARARELAESAAADGGRTVVWILDTDGEPELAEQLATLAVEGGLPSPAPELEVLPGSYDVPGARLLDLVSVMDRLRSPGGCPWDAQQTHESLVKYLVEESYELVEAIEEGDRPALREELGDVLLQVLFHSRIAQEHPEDPFGIDEVAGGIVDKLVFRHPHVFADAGVPASEHLEATWDKLKAAEKQRESLTDGVPLGQPSLALAAKLLSRARKAGLDLPLETEFTPQAPPAEEDLGELLLALAKTADAHSIDPEQALRAAALRYRARIREAEAGGPSGGSGAGAPAK